MTDCVWDLRVRIIIFLRKSRFGSFMTEGEDSSAWVVIIAELAVSTGARIHHLPDVFFCTQ